MTAALVERGYPDALARLAAEFGAIALKQAFEQWVSGRNRADLAHLMVEQLTTLRRTAALL
ncbi:hypothetical protein [Calidifontibacter terrae]